MRKFTIFLTAIGFVIVFTFGAALAGQLDGFGVFWKDRAPGVLDVGDAGAGDADAPDPSSPEAAGSTAPDGYVPPPAAVRLFAGEEPLFAPQALSATPGRIWTTSVLVRDYINNAFSGTPATLLTGNADVAALDRSNADIVILARDYSAGPTYFANAPQLDAAALAALEEFLVDGGCIATEHASNGLWFSNQNWTLGNAAPALPTLAFGASVLVNGGSITGGDIPADAHDIVTSDDVVAGLSSGFRDDNSPTPGAGDLHGNLEGDLAGNGIVVLARDSDETYGAAPEDIETIARAAVANGTAVMLLSDWQDLASVDPNVLDPDIATLWSNIARLPCRIAVDIDIKPGSYPNSINLKSRGVVPVAIFGADLFDVREIDPDTLRLADADVRMAGKSGKSMCRYNYVDGDPYEDMVCHFNTIDLALAAGDLEAEVHGSLFNGAPFSGSDSVRIVPAN